MFHVSFDKVLTLVEQDGNRFVLFIGGTGLLGIFWSRLNGPIEPMNSFRHGMMTVGFSEMELTAQGADDAFMQFSASYLASELARAEHAK